MGKKKINNLSLFNKLAKQTKAAIAKDPNVSMSWREIQKFTSNKIYPQFKGTPATKVTLTSITRSVQSEFKEHPEISSCANVFNVPDEDIISVEWWDLQNLLKILPPNLNIRIDGGPFGSTNIAHVSDLDYHIHMIGIIDAIRPAHGSDAEWNGTRRLIPGKRDDNKNCSYFVDFTLSVNGLPMDEVFQEPDELTDEEIEERLQRKKEAQNKRIRGEERKKLKVIKELPRPSVEETPVIPIKKGKKKEKVSPKPTVSKVKKKTAADTTRTKKPKTPVKPKPKVKTSKPETTGGVVEAMKTLKELFKEGLIDKKEFFQRFDALTNKLGKGGTL